MIRILQVVSNMDRAGIETMLMNYYRNIDRNVVQFDFLCNKKKIGAYDNEIISLGGNIYHSPGLNPLKFRKYKKYMKELFFQHNEIKIIHVHNGALGQYALYCAKKNNIKVRIFHAHGASISKDLKLPLKLVCKSQINKTANQYFACSTAAAKCYFGKKHINDFTYIRNAIDTSKFIFNQKTRNEIREKNNLSDKFVIGHVGRFMKQKNHKFILEIFQKVSQIRKNAVLVLIGDGELLPQIKQYADKLKIKDKIIFMGNIASVNEWYQAFDVFILPSIFEGLPVVGIEAQVADLKCIFSDNITKEVNIVEENTLFISVKDKEKWIDTLINFSIKENRIDRTNDFIKANYEISCEAKKLENIYLDLSRSLKI